MGADLITTSFEGLSYLEDHYKRTPNSKTDYILGGIYRWITIETIWRALGHYANVVQHEFFGHGWQIRNLQSKGWKLLGYDYDHESIFTKFLKPEWHETIDLNLVASSGTEAQTILAMQLRQKMFHDNIIDGRFFYLYSDATLGLSSYLNYFVMNYLEENNELDDSYDLKSYFTTYEQMHPNQPILMKDLYWLTFTPFLDPFLWAQLISYFTYVLLDKPLPTPVIKVGAIRFIPSICSNLTPSGVEIILEQYFSYKTNVYKTYMRWTPSHESTICGAGFKTPHLIQFKQVDIGVIVDFWVSYQKTIQQNMHFGNQTSVSACYQLSGLDQLQLGAEIGYKTRGYLIGYPYDKGLITRWSLLFNF
jgi:hypothetical protein